MHFSFTRANWIELVDCGWSWLNIFQMLWHGKIQCFHQNVYLKHQPSLNKTLSSLPFLYPLPAGNSINFQLSICHASVSKNDEKYFIKIRLNSYYSQPAAGSTHTNIPTTHPTIADMLKVINIRAAETNCRAACADENHEKF